MMENSQLNRIPSIELQLLKWIALVDAAMIPNRVDLQRAGTRIWIKRARHDLAGFGEEAPALTLSNVQVNRRLQGKGWFTGFSGQVIRSSAKLGAGCPKTRGKMGGFPEQNGAVSAVKGATYPRQASGKSNG